jgi:hypothetical protein
MANDAPKYRRLRWTGSFPGFGYHGLWEAEDHLLQVHRHLGLEKYKRFYFADIQAVAFCKTDRGTLGTFLYICLAVLFELGARASFMVFDVFALAGIMFGLLAVVNVLLGPTCATTITTAVQTEKIHSLNRLRKTLQFMDRLRPTVERFQKTTPVMTEALQSSKPLEVSPRPAAGSGAGAQAHPLQPGSRPEFRAAGRSRQIIDSSLRSNEARKP